MHTTASTDANVESCRPGLENPPDWVYRGNAGRAPSPPHRHTRSQMKCPSKEVLLQYVSTRPLPLPNDFSGTPIRTLSDACAGFRGFTHDILTPTRLFPAVSDARLKYARGFQRLRTPPLIIRTPQSLGNPVPRLADERLPNGHAVRDDSASVCASPSARNFARNAHAS